MTTWLCRYPLNIFTVKHLFQKDLFCNFCLTLSDTGGEGPFCSPSYQLYRNKIFLNRFSQLSFILLYFILIKFIFTRSGQISANVSQRVMRYGLFVEERYNISRISNTYKRSFICILMKHPYIPHINNVFLIPELFVRSMMTGLWRHYWFHDVLWRLNKQTRFFYHIR